MEFLYKNYFNTTTQAVVNSSTSTVENILKRDIRYQYISSGASSDAGTAATLKINFDATVTVSRIALLGHNLREFRIYYNGTTASTFSLTTTGATVTSYFTSNSETALYLRAAPVYCTSVSIDMVKTITANQEKALGYLVISDLISNLGGRVPNAQSYHPSYNQKQVMHELSDGSVRTQVVDRKFGCAIGLDFVSPTVKNEIKGVYDMHDDFIFCAFGTTTGWDEVIFPCVWTNGFEFHEVTDNALNAGYSGSIKLAETRPA